MNEAELLALEAYPVKYTSETWVRKPADVNTPLRRAFVEGYNQALKTIKNKPQ